MRVCLTRKQAKRSFLARVCFRFASENRAKYFRKFVEKEFGGKTVVNKTLDIGHARHPESRKRGEWMVWFSAPNKHARILLKKAEEIRKNWRIK